MALQQPETRNEFSFKLQPNTAAMNTRPSSARTPSLRTQGVDSDMRRAWHEMQELPEADYRGMMVRCRLKDLKQICSLETRRKTDLKRIRALETMVSEQAAEIARLQAMMGTVLAAPTNAATPEEKALQRELESYDLELLLEQFRV